MTIVNCCISSSIAELIDFAFCFLQCPICPLDGSGDLNCNGELDEFDVSGILDIVAGNELDKHIFENILGKYSQISAMLQNYNTY